jgi:hypothetical protein
LEVLLVWQFPLAAFQLGFEQGARECKPSAGTGLSADDACAASVTRYVVEVITPPQVALARVESAMRRSARFRAG